MGVKREEVNILAYMSASLFFLSPLSRLNGSPQRRHMMTLMSGGGRLSEGAEMLRWLDRSLTFSTRDLRRAGETMYTIFEFQGCFPMPYFHRKGSLT